MIPDDWDDDGPADAWTKWGGGCAAPLAAALYSASIIHSGHARLIGLRGRVGHVAGTDAMLVAMAILGFAALLHARHFWSQTRALAGIAPMAQFLGLATTAGCLLAVAVRGLSLL